MTTLSNLPKSLVALTFALSVFVNATSSDNTLNATSPFDPFEQLRIRAIPRPSEPVCCLKPLSSDLLPLSAELISFEEWKSKQLELQEQGANQTPLPDVSETRPGASLPASTAVLAEAESSFFYQTETVPSTSRHIRVPLTDRFNYASLDCSARVHTSHSSARSPSAILSSKRDWYMLSPCGVDPNFVVIELCDDIRIDTVQLANFEFFSGVFRDFRVSVAQTYTPDGQAWTEAGTYQAKNIRGVQSFHPTVELRPFYRFVRIDFLTHYGSEFYCPISLLRVYGLTQMEEWKLEAWQGGSEGNSPESLIQIGVTDDVKNESSQGGSMSANGSYLLDLEAERTTTPVETTANEGSTAHSPSVFEGSLVKDREAQEATTPLPPLPLSSVLPSPISEPSSTPEPSIASNSETIAITTNVATASHEHSVIEGGEAGKNISSCVSDLTVENTSSVIVSNSSQSTSVSLPTSSTQPLPPTPSPTPVPSGESIYRTIMNRLTMLETNTTLYQQYVAEQTLQVRKALGRLEEEVGRLEGISKAQQHTFVKLVQDLERRRSRMEEERWELLNKVNHLADEVILEKRLSIAQLWLLLAVLVFMTFTRGSRTDAASLLDDTMHRLNSFGRRSARSSADWTLRWTSRSPTPNARHRSAAGVHQEDISSIMIPEPGSETGPSSPEALPATPPARSQTPRSHPSRPSNPRHHSNVHLGNSERPTRRLRRSNSYTTPANTHLSPKRFAHTAHLHELQQSIRLHVKTSGSDEAQSEGDGPFNKSPRRRGYRTEHLPSTFPSQNNPSLRKVADCEVSEADSWVDTEAGSESNMDSVCTDSEGAGGHEEEIRVVQTRLRRPISSSSLGSVSGAIPPTSPTSTVD